jgi:hypothetical protein
MTSASSPLIITLRHILMALATPIRWLTTFASMPQSVSAGASAVARTPPSSIGTLIPKGGTEVMTPAST